MLRSVDSSDALSFYEHISFADWFFALVGAVPLVLRFTKGSEQQAREDDPKTVSRSGTAIPSTPLMLRCCVRQQAHKRLVEARRLNSYGPCYPNAWYKACDVCDIKRGEIKVARTHVE